MCRSKTQKDLGEIHQPYLHEWENHAPVLPPDYIAVLNGKLLEVSRFYVPVVLRMWLPFFCYFTCYKVNVLQIEFLYLGPIEERLRTE